MKSRNVTNVTVMRKFGEKIENHVSYLIVISLQFRNRRCSKFIRGIVTVTDLKLTLDLLLLQ